MSLGSLIRVGHRVRFTPRNRDADEWPGHWAEAMSKRGTITRTVMTRAGATKAVVRWDGRVNGDAISVDALDYVAAGDANAPWRGRRVRLLPTKEAGKTSVMLDWAGAIGTVVSDISSARVLVEWPKGGTTWHSIFGLEEA